MTVAIGTKVDKLRQANDKAIYSDMTILKDLVDKFVDGSPDQREALRPILTDRANHFVRMLSRDEGFDLVERMV